MPAIRAAARSDAVRTFRSGSGLALGPDCVAALDSYRQSPPCTGTVSTEKPVSGGKRKKKTAAAQVYGAHGFCTNWNYSNLLLVRTVNLHLCVQRRSRFTLAAI
ncbi:MAG: hypothetical protein WBW33_15420 [Bryobacteraceae bacterium]